MARLNIMGVKNLKLAAKEEKLTNQSQEFFLFAYCFEKASLHTKNLSPNMSPKEAVLAGLAKLYKDKHLLHILDIVCDYEAVDGVLFQSCLWKKKKGDILIYH